MKKPSHCIFHQYHTTSIYQKDPLCSEGPLILNLLYRRAFTMPSVSVSARSKYSLILARATVKVDTSSIVLGTATSLSKSPRMAFSTISLRTRRSILPDLVLGIIPLPWMMPPSEAIAPTWPRTNCCISLTTSSLGAAGSAQPCPESATKAKGS